MQEPATTPLYHRLNVWALTASFAISGLILGFITLPLRLLKRHGEERMFGGPPPWAGAGTPHPWTGPSGAPQPWSGSFEPHGPWAAHAMMHHGPGVGWHIIAIVIVAIFAGIAGALIAAVYNALLPRK